MTWCFMCSSCCSSQAHFGSKLSYAQGIGRSCSQNHTVTEAGRDMWRSSSSTLAQGLIQLSFEYLPRWWCHNLFGQPVPVFDHPHGRSFFLRLNWISCISKFVPFASCSLTCNLWVWLSSLLPHHVFLHSDQFVCKDVMGDTIKTLAGVKTCQYEVGHNLTSVMMVFTFPRVEA